MLSKTPPMGWNSWNTFTHDINEKLIMETADAMVSTGLKDAGYEYVVIDDCWSERQRDENGCLVADHVKFPRGMKPVADYVHDKGLKFGMYSCDGNLTCAGYPGSFMHEFEDARYFASVGVDLLKYDNCYKPKGEDVRVAYQKMAIALKASGREILFSACNWGSEDPHLWMRSVGAHMYRSTGDITDTFESIKTLGYSQTDKLHCSAPGCFNDLDMLVTGLYGKGNIGFGKGCSDNEYRFHFAMWCMFGSPLMIGADIRNLTEGTLKLLKNKYLIRINQDEEARPPFFVHPLMYWGNPHNVMFKHLSDNEYAIALFNDCDKEYTVSGSLSDMGIPVYSGYGLELFDVFEEKSAGAVFEVVQSKIEPHDCKVYLAKLVKR